MFPFIHQPVNKFVCRVVTVQRVNQSLLDECSCLMLLEQSGGGCWDITIHCLPYTHSCCKSYLPKATKNRHLAGYSWSKSVGEMNSCDSFTHGWQRARKVADTFIMMTLNSHGSRICLNAGLLTFFWQVGLKWGTALWTCTHTHVKIAII